MGSVCSIVSTESIDSNNEGKTKIYPLYADDDSVKIMEVRKATSYKLVTSKDVRPMRKRYSFSGIEKANDDVSMMEIFCSYLPQHLFYNISSLIKESNDKSCISLLSTFEYETCILMLDISGFTQLTGTLSREKNGIELLTKYINQYFTTLISQIYEHGGDIEKFAGDGIICQFYNPFDENKKNSLVNSILCAIQCALRIQGNERIRQFKVNESLSLTLHCGISVGKVTSKHLGGVNGLWLRLTEGKALGLMESALEQSGVGEVVITNETYEKVQSYVNCIRIDGKKDKSNIKPHLFKVQSFRKERFKISPLPRIAMNNEIIDSVKKFINSPVQLKVKAGQIEWINEIKALTIGFFSIVDDNKYSSEFEKLQIYHTVVKGTQEIVDKYEGFIANFLADEKGFIVVVAFGYPYNHMNDAVRATKAMLDIKQIISSFNLRGGFGVTSGKCFIGNVGSVQRREFTIYGDKVNLAARLMKESEKDMTFPIVIDAPTAEEISKSISVEYCEPIKVKGIIDLVYIAKVLEKTSSNQPLYSHKKHERSGPLSVSNTLKVDDEASQVSSSSSNFATINPLLDLKYPIGREKEFDMISSLIEQKLREFENKSITKSRLIILKSDVGIGKSDLSNRLIREWKPKLASVFNSALDTEEMTPFYVFQNNIHRGMVERLCKKHNVIMDTSQIDSILSSFTLKQKQDLLESIFDEKERTFLHLLNRVFGVEFEGNSEIDLHSETRIKIECDIISKFLTNSWIEMGYENKPWFLIIDDFHFMDKHSKIVLNTISNTYPTSTTCVILVTSRLLNGSDEVLEADIKRKELEDLCKQADKVIELEPLTKNQTREFILKYNNAKSMKDKVLDVLYEKSGGNPQFLLIASNFLLEKGIIIIEGDEVKLKNAELSFSELDLPSSMSSLIQHKIDRLNPNEQFILKVASVIGMVFDYDTLKAIFPEESRIKKQGKISKYLDILVSSHNLLEEVNDGKQSSENLTEISSSGLLKFKNSMILFIVYNMIPNEQKRTLHLSLSRHYIERLFNIENHVLSNERSSLAWLIIEIAHHYSTYFDKNLLQEIFSKLTTDSVENEVVSNYVKTQIDELNYSIEFLERALPLLELRADYEKEKAYSQTLLSIYQLIITSWKGPKQSPVKQTTIDRPIKNMEIGRELIAKLRQLREKLMGRVVTTNFLSLFLNISFSAFKEKLISIHKQCARLKQLEGADSQEVQQELEKTLALLQ